MADLFLLNDNTTKDIPQRPVITYELVADMGEDGTKTIYECESLTETYVAIDEIRVGEFDRPHLDLTADELENIETLSINVVLTATALDIVKYENEQSAMAELKSYKVVREPKLITGLCPRSWENTDISNLSRVQVNGILDNCEKCDRYSQCNKVAELNDKLVELDNEESEVQ